MITKKKTLMIKMYSCYVCLLC